jgi:hypothetical protein
VKKSKTFCFQKKKSRKNRIYPDNPFGYELFGRGGKKGEREREGANRAQLDLISA